jgi:hypothetical protein
MGPACAVVDARADGAMSTGSQKPHFAAIDPASSWDHPEELMDLPELSSIRPVAAALGNSVFDAPACVCASPR